MLGPRILIVEDEELIRSVLAEILCEEGFEVSQASTGDEAAELIDGPDGFHAVVTDIHMPGARDGISVGRHARTRHPQIAVIYCAGLPDALRAAGPLGQRDVLVRKPYLPSHIVTVLRDLLSMPAGMS